MVVLEFIPYLRLESGTDDREWFSPFITRVAEIFCDRAEVDLETQRAEDLIHEHAGAFQVVRGQEIELAVHRVRIHMAAVEADEASWES